jgi:hypothetical protein
MGVLYANRQAKENGIPPFFRGAGAGKDKPQIAKTSTDQDALRRIARAFAFGLAR